MTRERLSALQTTLGIGLLLLLAALAVGRSHLGTRLDSFTIDEPWHIVAGISYWRTGDFRLNPEHPPLSKLVAGAMAPADFKLRPLPQLKEKAQERELVADIMYLDNDNLWAQQAARRGMWAFHALLLVLLGVALWRAFGLAWAVGTLVFLAIEPTIGAHLPVVMTDLPLALTFGLAAVCAGVLASRWRWTWALACGVAFGLALGSKHSALGSLGGIAVVLAVAAVLGLRKGGWRELLLRSAHLLLAAAVAIGILWAQYGFQFHAGPDGSDNYNRAMVDKVADLNNPAWREGIAFADRYQLLPRSYLWGLTDTVRAGVEGRGQSSHWLWGTKYKGKPPWFTWPSLIVSKLPLALLALSLLGLALLPWSKLKPTARWTLWALLGGSAAHLAALMTSQGTYGGLRHALPLVVALAILAGGAVAWAWSRHSRAMGAVVGLLFVAALAMTIREPRLWEYHNELAGGTKGAYKLFDNESMDLGQRGHEIRRFHDRRIDRKGAPLFIGYWFSEQQAKAAGVHYQKFVADMDDDNAAGVYEGYFVYSMDITEPSPDWDWDPDVVMKDMTLVTRLGHIGIWKGRLVNPKGRAFSMSGKVAEYIYEKDGDDWPLVARRLEEVVQVLPPHAWSAIELGNAYLRMGDVENAKHAYRRPLQQTKVQIEALVRAQLEAKLAALEAGTDPTRLEPMRNPLME